MDWNDLRFALAVARSGSLSAAAQTLGVHQTTVGRRLEALEASLGVPLFLRTPKGLLPTSDGAQVLASIEELASSLTRFEQSMRGELSKVSGLVRVAVTETGARQLVERAIPDLLRAHPELVIELVPANVVADLGRGDADLAVRLVRPEEGLVARRLGFVRYALYASERYLRAHRQPIGEGLAGHRVLLPSRELARGPEASWLAEHAREAVPALHASSLATLAVAAESGLGLTVLPTNLGAMHPGLRNVRAASELPPRAVYLVMHPDQRKLPRVRAVADAVGDEIKRRLEA